MARRKLIPLSARPNMKLQVMYSTKNICPVDRLHGVIAQKLYVSSPP
jgi:hypothetical protein